MKRFSGSKEGSAKSIREPSKSNEVRDRLTCGWFGSKSSKGGAGCRRRLPKESSAGGGIVVVLSGAEEGSGRRRPAEAKARGRGGGGSGGAAENRSRGGRCSTEDGTGRGRGCNEKIFGFRPCITTCKCYTFLHPCRNAELHYDHYSLILPTIHYFKFPLLRIIITIRNVFTLI